MASAKYLVMKPLNNVHTCLDHENPMSNEVKPSIQKFADILQNE